MDWERRRNGHRCLDRLCCAFSSAPTLQKGLSLSLWLSLKQLVNCLLWKRALPVVAGELMLTCHSKAGWVWLLFLGSSIAVVLEMCEGPQTTPCDAMGSMAISSFRLVFSLLGKQRPLVRHSCWARGPHRYLCETRAGQTDGIEGSNCSLSRAHPKRTGSREKDCGQGNCHPL